MSARDSSQDKSLAVNRSFDRFYQDQLKFQEISKRKKEELTYEDNSKLKGLFKPRLFTRDFKPSQERVLSPRERSEQMYQEGKSKL